MASIASSTSFSTSLFGCGQSQGAFQTVAAAGARDARASCARTLGSGGVSGVGGGVLGAPSPSAARGAAPRRCLRSDAAGAASGRSGVVCSFAAGAAQRNAAAGAAARRQLRGAGTLAARAAWQGARPRNVLPPQLACRVCRANSQKAAGRVRRGKRCGARGLPQAKSKPCWSPESGGRRGARRVRGALGRHVKRDVRQRAQQADEHAGDIHYHRHGPCDAGASSECSAAPAATVRGDAVADAGGLLTSAGRSAAAGGDVASAHAGRLAPPRSGDRRPALSAGDAGAVSRNSAAAGDADEAPSLRARRGCRLSYITGESDA